MAYWLVLLLLILYQLGRVSLGLAMHPYRTMRLVVRDKWEWPLTLIPGGVLVAGMIGGRLGARMVDVPRVWQTELAVVLATMMVGLGLWQAVVGYLGWRFWRATTLR